MPQVFSTHRVLPCRALHPTTLALCRSQNATLRDNILCGAPLDPERYQAILDACALVPDLEVLPAGECGRGRRLGRAGEGG